MLRLEEHEYELRKTAQVQQILVALEAERAALLQHIAYFEAVRRAGGFGGYMFP